jgi:hypothetical protein
VGLVSGYDVRHDQLKCNYRGREYVGGLFVQLSTCACEKGFVLNKEGTYALGKGFVFNIEVI